MARLTVLPEAQSTAHASHANRVTFYRTSIGKKIIVAATGALLLLFLVGHMLGNLLAWDTAAPGHEPKLNAYARLLRVEPAALWTIRIVLIAAFVIHVVTTMLLVKENRRARPVRYAVKKPASTWAARTMALSGLALFAFLIYHLLHMTTGHAHPALFAQYGAHDVHGRVLASFRRPVIALTYLAAMTLLFLHLRHGITSLFQTLGLSHHRFLTTLRRGGPALAVLLVLGFVSVPLAIWAGLLR